MVTARVRIPGCILSLLLLPAIAIGGEPITRHYDWLTADRVSGSLALVARVDGTRIVDFEFNDRGRGPKIHEELTSDQSGMLVSLQVSGHSYMGAPADTASIRKLADRTIRPGEGEQRVSLFAISGLELTPQYLWLDEDSELFAATMGWMSLAPRGLKDVLPELQEIQDQAEKDSHRELAHRLTNGLPADWILRNVRIVDVVSGTLKTGQTLAVSDGRIIRIMDDDRLQMPPVDDTQTRIIDGQGLTLIPGLWDMHTHLSLEDGLMQIAAGVTTVRDLANEPERLAAIRQAFDSGEVIGPRSFTAGFIDKKSPYSAPTGRLAESLEDALVMVREYAAMGYPQIKIYSSIDPEWVEPIAAEVHKNGMRLSGHIPSYMTATKAVTDGFDEIQHINMLFLNFLAGPEDDTRTPVRFSLVAEKAGEMDLDSTSVNSFIALLKEKGIVVDPTVTIFDDMFRHRSGELNPGYAM